MKVVMDGSFFTILYCKKERTRFFAPVEDGKLKIFNL